MSNHHSTSSGTLPLLKLTISTYYGAWVSIQYSNSRPLDTWFEVMRSIEGFQLLHHTCWWSIFSFFFCYTKYLLGYIYMRINILHIRHFNVYCIVLPMSIISNDASSKLDNRMESKVMGSRYMRCMCDLIKKHLLALYCIIFSVCWTSILDTVESRWVRFVTWLQVL